MSLYESGAAFPNMQGDVKLGNDIRAEMEPFAASKPDLQSNITKVVRAGDIALIHNEWKMPAMSMSGYAVEVARRQADGTWFIRNRRSFYRGREDGSGGRILKSSDLTYGGSAAGAILCKAFGLALTLRGCLPIISTNQ